ncbi:hypothetical protein [Sphingomonas sp. Leaf28]|nr:hypothetical protein [Sphingomonas sp. Leaf28]
MENHVKYRDSIYFHDDRALYVNAFVPSAVRWRERDAVLTQTTTFPDEPVTRLRWTVKRPTDIVLKLRHPGWSRAAIVLVNGVEVLRSTAPGRYLDIARVWRNDDVVELRLDMHPVAERLPGAPNIVAFTVGPLVLAGAFGRDGLAPGADIIVNERKYGEYNAEPFAAPKLAGDPETLAGAIRAGDRPLEFTIPSASGQPVRLIPYHRIAHDRYATYWDVAPAAT